MSKAALNIFGDVDAADIEPLGNQILVELIQTDKIGNIYLPDQSVENQTTRGKVLAVGPGGMSRDGTHRVKIPVAEGDDVILNIYGGQACETRDKKKVKMVEDIHVLARVRPRK